MKHIAQQQEVTLPADTSIDAEVGIGPIPQDFLIQFAMDIKGPSMDRAEAQKLVLAADRVCPYSNATRGDIEVKLNVA